MLTIYGVRVRRAMAMQGAIAFAFLSILVWGTFAPAVPGTEGTHSLVSWFTGYGHYMPRIFCIRKADGSPDWPWIYVLIGASVVIVLAYTRIYVHWLQCYFSEIQEHRISSLLDLANMFLLCAFTSYIVNVAIFFWPVYRLMGLLLVIHTLVCYRFVQNLKPMEQAFEANRLWRDKTRTEAALTARNAAMRNVLDSVGQAYMVVDATGVVAEGASSQLYTWFGSPAPDMTIWAFFSSRDAKFGARLECGWPEVFDGLMPVEVTLDQLPKRLLCDGQYYGFEYISVGAGESPDSVLIIVSNITAEVQEEQVEMVQRDFITLVDRLNHNPSATFEFLEETGRLVNDVVNQSRPNTEKRDIHTIKGNCGLYGLNSVADYCHALETQLEESARRTTRQERLALEETWTRVLSRFESVFGHKRELVQISPEGFENMLAALRERVAHVHLDRIVRSWSMDPVESRLQHISSQAQALAKRMGKGPIEVHVDAQNVHLSAERWKELWSSFIHVVRNMVGHGVLMPHERAAGVVPRLNLRAHTSDGCLTIMIQDNGPGIDWEKVALKAAQKGLPSSTHDDLVAAMFTDGISTKEDVDDISGRGVGMGAVADAVRSLQGHIVVESTPGKGTTFRFVFPAYETQDLVVSHS